MVNASSIEDLDSEGLRDPDGARSEPDSLQVADYFVFRLSGRTYALPPRSVEMVVPMQSIVPVPTLSTQVRGVMHLRGRIIAVIDLAGVLRLDEHHGAQPRNVAASDRRIVVMASRQPYAFVADATLGIWELGRSGQTRCTDEGPLVRGRIEVGGGAATVLEPSAVLDRLLGVGAGAVEAGER